MPEVIGDAAEYFDSVDSEALAQAIEKVVYNPDYSKELARRGRLRLGEFSWKKCALETRDVYKKVCG
jgi:glycosyltransferase involved in cell wall biosynthesis